MAFDPLEHGATEVIEPPQGAFDPIAHGATEVIDPLAEDTGLARPLDPQVAFDRAGEVWDISTDLDIPLQVTENNWNTLVQDPKSLPVKTFPSQELAFTTPPEPDTFTKIKEWFIGKPGERPLSLPPDANRAEKIDRAIGTLKGPLKVTMKFVKGLELNLGDLAWALVKKVTPESMWDKEVKKMNLDDAIDWAMGYDPTGFTEWAGEVAEFSGRLKTANSIIGPGGVGPVQTAVQTAKVFGAAAAAGEISKGLAETVDDAEYGYGGAQSVARDIVIGAIFSFARSGAKGLWSKLKPSEQKRALDLLKLKKGATPQEITRASHREAIKYHPDKVKGMMEEFDNVIRARDVLRNGPKADMIYRGTKVDPKLLGGEVAKAPSQVPTAAPVAKQPAKAPTTPTKPATALAKAKPPALTKGDDGKSPVQRVQESLGKAKAVQPKTRAEKRAALKKRVGAAAGALRSSVKQGVPTEEAIFRSTGLLKGPLTDYEQVYESIDDTMSPEDRQSLFSMIDEHPDLQYFEKINTATSLRKLLAGNALSTGTVNADVRNIERVFGKAFKPITDVRLEKTSLYDKAIAVWKAGLLTGIKTQGLNLLSNVSHAISESSSNVPGAGVDRIIKLWTGERALAATSKGYTKGAKEGVGRGWKYFRTGVDERDIGAKLDYKHVNFGDSKFAQGLQAYEETIFHLLGAADQPFYYGMKAASITNQAEAMAINKGLKGKDRVSFIQNLQANPTDEMLVVAVHDAEVSVFQNKTHLGDLGKAFQKIPGGEIIAPFVRTPAAIGMQVARYTPAGPFIEVFDQIHQGEFNQRKFSQAAGRAVTGTAVLATGALLLTKGLMTLDRPKGEREQKLWELEGRKANSIKIGDKWRSVQVLGPAGIAMLIGGHFQRALTDTGSPTEAMIVSMAGGAKSLTEQTYLRGVNQAVDALVDPERSFENWFTSMAGSVVPTIVADIARAGDETERLSKGPAERFKSRVPGLRETLPPKIDVFGQDLPRYGGNVLEVMADPTRPAKIRNDVVVDELRRLFDKDVKVSPTLVGDKFGYKVLTPEENTQLWRRAGDLTYKVLQAMVNSEAYRGLNDFAKGQKIEQFVGKVREAAKMEMVGHKISQGVSVVELAKSGLLSVDGMKELIFLNNARQEE
ncbi:hypothetical protein KAR91_50845 [Candidatus Pacearchaeota archaeon]|nr:hypothetical protein [Candidatus Pacearchaeota archaeon]